jgi:hypothetical protein
MAVSVTNYSKNILSIENLDLSNPISYTVHVINDEGQFEEVISFPENPTLVLAAGATITHDLVNDSVFKLIISGSPNTEYYFLMDANIKACGKELAEKLLCTTCSSLDECGKLEHYKNVEYLMKYSILKESIYYIWNEIVQTQSVTDLIAADSDKLLLLSDLVSKLELICDNCSQDDICSNVYDSNGDPTGNCGCS